MTLRPVPARPGRPHGGRAAAALLGALACLAVVAGAAAGHAVLLESEPAAGSRLDDAPAFVRVVLTEAVDPAAASLEVRDQQGRQVDHDDLVVEPGARPVLTVTLPPDLADGAYAARWKVLSTVDGHVTSGAVGFAVGGFDPPASHRGDQDRLDAASAAGRAVAFAGLAAVVGTIAFAAALPLAGAPWLARLRRVQAAGAALHAAGVAIVWVDARRDAGMGLTGFAATEVGRILSQRLLVAVGMAALALLWWRRPVRVAPAVLGVGAVAAALLSARLGHASQDGPVAIALDAAHLLASVLWVGALGALALLLRRAGSLGVDRDRLAWAGRRFGTLAAASVVALAATGTIVAVEIVGPAALRPGTWTSAWWGRILVTKWLLLAAMLAVALRNRRRFVLGPAGPADPRFARSVALEAAIGVAVLALAGLLTSVGAPADAEPPAPALPMAGEVYYGSLRIEPAPVAGGQGTLRFFIQGPDGPLEQPRCGRADCLRVRVADPDGGVETRFLAHEGGGHWTAPAIVWTMPGRHAVEVEVQSAEVYLDRLRVDVDVGGQSQPL